MVCKVLHAFSSFLCGLSIHGGAHAELKSPVQDAVLPSAPSEPASASILITDSRFAALDTRGIDGNSPAPQPSALTGPPEPRLWTDHVPKSESAYRTFGSQFHQIRWETLGLLGYFTVVNSPKLFKPMESFHFKDEGWFGKSTLNLGVDKLTHAFDSYLLISAES